jgi:hypothetical protein
MLRGFQQTYHVPGTLAADLNIRFTAPFDMQLVHVSAVNSTTSTATLDIGPSTDTDSYLDAVATGASNVPAEYDQNDFVGGQFPHIAKGVVVCITLDHDTTTDATDWTCVLTFTEG